MKRMALSCGVTVLAIAVLAPAASAASAKAKRVGVRSSGAQATGGSLEPRISADGRYVAFYSSATNLVANDTNAFDDIFVHDRVKKKTRRVSVRTGGAQAPEDSFDPSISADGRYVAFASGAADLVGNDMNGKPDIFVHDRRKKKTTRVSVRTDGAQAFGNSFAPSISADGRYVAFHSDAPSLIGNDTNSKVDVFVHNRKKRRTKRVSVGTGGTQATDRSFWPSISANGRYVAFYSDATDFIGNDTNGKTDIFTRGTLR
jgi:Tol biopolymer transport system component